MDNNFQPDIEFARTLDDRDPLSAVRDRFYLQDDQIYMDGNSLGLCSRDAERCLFRVFDEWKTKGIECWTEASEPLFLYQDYLGKLMAPLIGADADEVTVHASTTINIHSAIATFYRPVAGRKKILVDDLNFPTDRYAIDSQIRLKGLDPDECVSVVKSRDGKTIQEDDVVTAMEDDVALVFLSAVLYRSGQLLDMDTITAEARKRNIVAGWDLCHSIGVIPHDFKKLDADFAVWCNYKYLNGGPGAAAGLYINRKYFDKTPGLAGWHGNRKETQFDMKHEFEPARYAGGWQTGTQHVLSMAPLEGSLKMFNEIGIGPIREKSLKLTAWLMYLIDVKLAQYGFGIGNPREDHRRGGHVALEHKNAIRINAALKDNGVIPDFRYPNVIRLAPVALYTSYSEVFRVVEIIEDIMVNRKYDNYEGKRGLVA